MALPADGRATYDKIADPPKALVLVSGANHYGVCDGNNPAGAEPDASAPELEQALAVETVARWTAMFLRARVLGEADAAVWLDAGGDPSGPGIELVQEP